MQVNLSEPYCGRLGGRANNWNLVLGCFHGVVRDLEYSRKILGNQVWIFGRFRSVAPH